jgi:aryl-alcohol dehydrogenase-like predicted oxidoreductase
MKYRVLGRTGLQVSEIGFGCGNIGGLMVRAPLEYRLAALNRAIELGINYFDTAAQYGDGQSEINLGEVLSLIRSDVRIATKIGVTKDDLMDISSAIQRYFEAGLKRLRRDKVDVLQLHTPVSNNEANASNRIDVKHVLGKNGVADAFDLIRSKGLAQFIGFSGLGDIDALHQIVESDRFDVIQIYFNLLNPSAAFPVSPGFASQDFRGLLHKAAAHKMGVIIIRVLAGGALGDKTARSGYAAKTVGLALVPGSEYGADVRRTANLNFLLGNDITDLTQAGIRFALNQPDVSTVLVGFSDIAQIESAVACSGQRPFSRQVIECLNKLWSTNFEITS